VDVIWVLGSPSRLTSLTTLPQSLAMVECIKNTGGEVYITRTARSLLYIIGIYLKHRMNRHVVGEELACGLHGLRRAQAADLVHVVCALAAACPWGITQNPTAKILCRTFQAQGPLNGSLVSYGYLMLCMHESLSAHLLHGCLLFCDFHTVDLSEGGV
jgi:hypothetical protein